MHSQHLPDNEAFRHDSLSYSTNDSRPIDILIPTPPMGGKIWLLEGKGLFVLERGPGTLRTLAVTHAGSGALEAIDGVPNAEGFFPDGQMAEPLPPMLGHLSFEGQKQERLAAYAERRKAYDSRNGRPIYAAAAGVMGSWMLDGGFQHGLTIRALSGNKVVCATASIVWVAYKARKA